MLKTLRSLHSAYTLAIFALIGNVVALGINQWLIRTIRDLQGKPMTEQVPVPVGIALDGQLVSAARYRTHRCHLIRLESTGCVHCQADKQSFVELERDAFLHNCSSTVVAPSELDFSTSLEPRRVSLAFPFLGFSSSVGFRRIPTTVIAGPNWSVEWEKIGALEEADKRVAARALRQWGDAR
jgi:hypothetical protein